MATIQVSDEVARRLTEQPQKRVLPVEQLILESVLVSSYHAQVASPTTTPQQQRAALDEFLDLGRLFTAGRQPGQTVDCTRESICTEREDAQIGRQP